MSSEYVDAEVVVPSSSPLPPSLPSLSTSPFPTVITNHGERKTTTQQVNTDFELGNLFFPRVFAGSLSFIHGWVGGLGCSGGFRVDGGSSALHQQVLSSFKESVIRFSNRWGVIMAGVQQLHTLQQQMLISIWTAISFSVTFLL
jgi:hypothetical protein